MGENQIITPRGLRSYCTAALLLLCSIFNCNAQNYNDLGSWFALSVSRSFSDKFSAAVRVEHRTLDSFQELNQAYSRASLYYKPVNWLRIDMNLDWAYTPSGNRIRYIPGLRLSHKTESGTFLYLREWYMRTQYPGQELDPGNTLRTKAGLSRPVGERGLTPHLDYEIFYWDKITQQRFYLGGKFPLSDSVSLDVFYLYQLLPVKKTGTHILGATLSFTLP
ncbi:MAG: DUF2490 domain-containing protein [Bacteroidales bacterium]|nr:DUF2490 domain-containing protein [Bacteroidales bacterium]